MRTTRRVVYLNPEGDGRADAGGLFAAQAALLGESGIKASMVDGLPEKDIAPGDLVVAPPHAMGLLAHAPGEKWIYAAHRLDLFAGSATPSAWENVGAKGVLCTSRPLAELVEGVFPDMKTRVVHPHVEFRHFAPGAKRLAIAVSGGNPEEIAFMRNVFAVRSRRYREARWVETDGLEMMGRAEVLAESSVYLHLGSDLGLDTGPLEAWASGCLVVGVKSLGTSEYVGPANGIWVEPGDMLEMADDLELAATLVKNDHQSVRTMLDHGRASAAEYGLERTAAELADFIMLKPL